METSNPILKYLFPLLMFLQYFGCNSYENLIKEYPSHKSTREVSQEDCSDLKKYQYNGFYKPSDEGRLFIKRGTFPDTLTIAEQPVISLNQFESVIK